MAIEVANRTKYRINRPLIERAVKLVLRFAKKSGDVSVVVIGDIAMKKLNYRFRRKKTPTDILSFAEQDSEAPQPGFIGELMVDYEQIKRQAKQFGHSTAWEFIFIVIHGVLHLVGYEDDTETGRHRMEKIGLYLIKKIKI